MLVAVCRHVSGHIVGEAVAVVILGLGVHIQGTYHLPLPGLKQGIVGEGGAAVVAGGGTAIGGFQPGQLLRAAVDYGVKPKVQKVAVVIQVRLGLIFGLGHGDLAAAAVGQGVLMHTYEKFFADYGQIVAQVLITKTEAIDRHRYTNTRNTFMELMRQRVIPIVNENDVVALDELKIGDNDNMSALVAGIVDADLVIILSDVDGLYTANPQTHPDAVIVPEVAEITPEIEASAGGVGSARGTGGMATKIQAAKAATSSGIHLVIASGTEKNAITRVLQGEELGTLFVSRENRLQFRKRWLAFGAKIAGSIVVDDGCAKAIRKAGGCSILPAGVFAVQGEFLPGSTVSVIDKDAHELARGLVHYSSAELEQIKGCNSGEIANILGHKNFDEVIHRDDLVIL